MSIDLHSTIFKTYDEAIGAVGGEVVRVRVAAPCPLVPPPCNMEMDCVNPQVPALVYTEVTFRLEQFVSREPGLEPTSFWRYCRDI